MLLYHWTDRVKEALTEGFQDLEGGYIDGTDVWASWIRLTDRPIADTLQMPYGTMFAIDIPDEVVADWQFEQRDEYREFAVPAEFVNRYGPPLVMGDDQR